MRSLSGPYRPYLKFLVNSKEFLPSILGLLKGLPSKSNFLLRVEPFTVCLVGETVLHHRWIRHLVGSSTMSLGTSTMHMYVTTGFNRFNLRSFWHLDSHHDYTINWWCFVQQLVVQQQKITLPPIIMEVGKWVLPILGSFHFRDIFPLPWWEKG